MHMQLVAGLRPALKANKPCNPAVLGPHPVHYPAYSAILFFSRANLLVLLLSTGDHPEPRVTE